MMKDCSELGLIFLLLFFVFVFSAFGLNFFISSKTNSFKKNTKQAVYKILFENLKGFTYINVDPQKYAKIYDKLLEFCITRNFNTLYCDDYIEYKDGDFRLEMYDIGLYNKIVMYKSSSVQKIFEGLMLVTKCNKDFEGTTLIRRRDDLQAAIYDEASLKRVKLEDTEFENVFDVYSTNQVEARYLLTTSFMERLLDLYKNQKYDVTCSFENGQIILMIDGEKDWFDFSLEKSLTDKNNLDVFSKDIQNVLAIVDLLRIKENIGL